jgi:hypothetical protein
MNMWVVVAVCGKGGCGATVEPQRAPWPPWAHPAIVILFVTGCFHLYRGAPVDAVAFLGVAAWLAVAETRAPAPLVDDPSPSTVPPGRAVPMMLLPVTVVLAVAPRYGDVDTLAVGAIGMAAVVVAATRGDAVPRPRHGRAWPYAVVGLVAAVNELVAYLLETSPAAEWRHPAFSDLMDPAFGWAPTRGLLVLCWIAAGLWLLHAMPQRARAGGRRRCQVGPDEGRR